MDRSEYLKFAHLPKNKNAAFVWKLPLPIIKPETHYRLRLPLDSPREVVVRERCKLGEIQTCDICGPDQPEGIECTGVSWFNYDEPKENRVERRMCFNCMYNCAMQYYAKEKFIEDSGIDPMTQIRTELSQLKTEMRELREQS